jgi:hypothetical protein
VSAHTRVIDPLSCSGIDWAAFLILDISNTVIEAIPTGVVSHDDESSGSNGKGLEETINDAL